MFASAAGTLDQLEASALTVWIRIDRSNQKGPRLKLRWQNGLHLPVGDSDAEREEGADQLWQALSPRAGRQDVGARDLPRTLYGEHVRCISFLSTSVRASVTTNLLAQPLNEISERRIFEAIAALTGIDHELEKERQARRHEHDRLREAGEAESDLATWEQSAQVVEDGSDARDRARGQVMEAEERWRSRTARQLCDALQRDAEIEAEIRQIDTEIERDSRTARELSGQAPELADDKAFAQRQQTAMTTFGRLDRDDREMGNQIAALEHQLHRAAEEATAVRDGLLYGTGGDLVAAVRDVLTAAGFEVHDLDAELGGTKSADLLAARGKSENLYFWLSMRRASRARRVAVHRAAGVHRAPGVSRDPPAKEEPTARSARWILAQPERMVSV